MRHEGAVHRPEVAMGSGEFRRLRGRPGHGVDRLEGEMAKGLHEAAIVPPQDFDHDRLGGGTVRTLVVPVFDEDPFRLRIAADVIERGERRDGSAPRSGFPGRRSTACVDAGPARRIAGWEGIAETAFDGIGRSVRSLIWHVGLLSGTGR